MARKLSFLLLILVLLNLSSCKRSQKEQESTFYVPEAYINSWYSAFGQNDLWVFRDSATGRVDTFFVAEKSRIVGDKRTESHVTSYKETATVFIRRIRTNSQMGWIQSKGDYEFGLQWGGANISLTEKEFANLAKGDPVKPIMYSSEDNTSVKKTTLVINNVEIPDVYDVKLNDNPALAISPVSHLLFSSPKGVLKMTYRSGGYSLRIN